MFEQREGLGGELADIGREPAEVCARADPAAHVVDHCPLQFDGKPMHMALRYGITQALLHATALSHHETMAEVIARAPTGFVRINTDFAIIDANLQFSATHGVAPMTEVLPFEEAPAAYERMMSGQARFRVVLDMQTSSQMGTERAGGR